MSTFQEIADVRSEGTDLAEASIIAASGQPLGSALIGTSVRIGASFEGCLLGTRILIVDDDEDSQEILRVLLQRSGATVVAVTSATSALEAYARDRFDAVISDIGMPDIDGCAFMRVLRRRDAAVPAIALSGHGRDEDTTQTRQAGFQRHFRKPAAPVDLIAALANLVRPQH